MAGKRTSAISGRTRNFEQIKEPPTIERRPQKGMHPALNVPMQLRLRARKNISLVAIECRWPIEQWLEILETVGLCDSELPVKVLIKLLHEEIPLRAVEYLRDTRVTDLRIAYEESEKHYRSEMHHNGNLFVGFGATPLDAMAAMIQRHLDTNGSKITATHLVEENGETQEGSGDDRNNGTAND